MRIELGPQPGTIIWIDPSAVAAVHLMDPETTSSGLPCGPWTVRVAIGKAAPHWVDVYRHTDADHARAVAAQIARICPQVGAAGPAGEADVHEWSPALWPYSDGALLLPERRHE